MTIDRATLLAQLSALPERPFRKQVVQSPWDGVTNISSLNFDVRTRAQRLLAECGKLDAIRSLTIAAPPGYGKTHLLAWLRHACERHNPSGLFVYVTPYVFGSNVTFDQHLLRSVVQAVYLRSSSQKRLFTQSVQRFMESLLPAPNTTADMRRAVQSPAFLDEAFAAFGLSHPPVVDGVRLERHTFVAMLLMIYGDQPAMWTARRWLEGEHVPPLPCYTFPAPLQTVEETRDALYTINVLSAYPFCLAFDQMEDTAQSLPAAGSAGWASISGTLRALFTIPRVCSIFLFQQSVWQHFVSQAPPMLVDRMSEGDGVRLLALLDDTMATQLVAERMNQLVWPKLNQKAPAAEPTFPFTSSHIHRLRVDSGGEVRHFLRLAHACYEQLLAGQSSEPASVPLRLHEIAPSGAFTHEEPRVLIYADGLPANVDVLFGEQPAIAVVCHPQEGRLEATAPRGLLGEVVVTVRDATNHARQATVMMNLKAMTVPKPYGKFIDRQKLKARRDELGLTLEAVASMTGFSASTISNLELGKTAKPRDELFEKLAEAYGRPLRDFLKSKRPAST